MLKKILITVAILSPVIAFAQIGITPIRAEMRSEQRTTPVRATTTEPWAPKGQCIVTAVDARENALMASQTAFSTATISAINTRKDALRTAWLIESRTDRIAARAAVWKKFRENQNAARRAYDTANKTAWSNFRTAEKNCKVDTGEAPTPVSNTTTI